MTIVPLGAWTPDQPQIDAPHLVEARGVIPTLKGYAPLPGLQVTTSAITARCRGAVAARDIVQGVHAYCGDSTKLYRLANGATWTDFSKMGGYGPAAAATRWRFAIYGDRLVTVNGIDAPQYIDMSTAATAFANLAGSPPIASYVASYGEFVFLAATTTNAMTLVWSAFGDSTGWTPGTAQSDEQDFADGGRITGLATSIACLYVFQEHAIRRVIYTGGDTVFQIDKIVDGVGCVEPNSLVQFGQAFFFLSEDGFYQWDGVSAPQPIGVESFDNWFQADSTRPSWYAMSAAINPRKKLVVWAYVSANSGGDLPDSLLIYNYAVQKASYARLATEIIFGAASQGASRDDAYYAALSAGDAAYASISSDDPSFQGGTYYLGGFDVMHKLNSFSGANVEALLETGSAQILDGQRARVPWIKPIADTAAATAAGASQVRPGDAITYETAVAQQTSGRCPQRGVNGFFVRAQIGVPAATTWTYVNGIDFDAFPAGIR